MAPAASVVSVGILVVDHVAAPIATLPSAGELVLTDDCQLHIGGCASNVAIDLARIGISARVVGCVGDDVFGDFVRESLEREGVDSTGVVVCNGTQTSQTLVVNVRGEDRRFIHRVGANGMLKASMLPLDLIREAQVLYVGGFFLLDRLDAGELAGVFERARAIGVRTVLDIVTPGTRDYIAALTRLLPHTDFFLPNADEARRMSNLDRPIEQARFFRGHGAASVVITQGSDGCLYSSEEREFGMEAFDVPFVDGTGGGDAFAAGFIAGLLARCEPEECVRRGAALGASCVRSSGATSGVFHASQFADFLADHPARIRAIR